MNYLTNYYKNLSEQLQQKVNLLESYIHQLNEELESETIGVGPAPSAGAGTTTNQPTNNSPLNLFLQAWGTSNPNYDFNRDGVVDGDDLGIFLAGMLKNGANTPTAMASNALPATTEQGAGAPATRMRAINQPSTRFTTARSTSSGPKSPVNPELDARTGTAIPVDVSTGEFVPPTPRPPKYTISPTSSPDQVMVGKKSIPNYGTGAYVPPTQTGGGQDDEQGGGQDRGTNNPPNVPPQGSPESVIQRAQVPYWMSTSTTDTDSSFRTMVPGRKRR